MADYLKPISKKLRIVCALALSIVAFLLLVLFIKVSTASHHRDYDYDFLLFLLFLGSVAFVFSYLAWRLWRGVLSGNSVTLIPTLFIQLFGVFFLVGGGFAAYKGSGAFLIEGVFIGLAMIFIGRNIAKRNRKEQ